MHLSLNPIIVKEVRSRMRGLRAFVTLTGLLLIFAGVSYGVFYLVQLSGYYGWSGVPLSAMIGQSIFGTLVYLMLLLIFAITPAITAGAISGEKQMQTYEMLMATPLSPSRILWGKLVSGLTYIFLLLFAAIPFASLVFIFGGVALRDMLKGLVVLVAIAVMVGVIGIFLSTLLNNTSRATVVTYLVIAVLIFAPIFLAILYSMIKQVTPPRWVLVISPLAALRSAIQPSLTSGGPLDSIFYALGMGYMMDTGWFSADIIPRPLYHYSLPFFGALTLILYMLATRLVQPIRRWRLSWKPVVTGLVAVTVFSGLVYGAFAMSSDRYGSENIFAVPTPQVFDKGFGVPEPPIAVEKVIPLEGDTSGAFFSAATQAEIYAQVIEALVAGGDSQGNPYQTIYVLKTTDDTVGDPNTPTFEPKTLDFDVQDQLIQVFMNQPDVKLIWVDSRDEAIIDETSVLVTLGTIQPKETGLVWVTGSMEGSTKSLGRTHVVSNGKEGVWVVVGDTGVSWEK